MKKVLFWVIILLFCLVLSDIFYRVNILGITQPCIFDNQPKSEQQLLSIAKKLSSQRDIDFRLYQRHPSPRIYDLVSSDLLEHYKGEEAYGAARQWNSGFVHQVLEASFSEYMPVMLNGYNTTCPTFTQYDSTIFPVYRYTANCSIPGTGLKFNDFGWTGANVNLAKPEKTIRIAFVGGSTTQQVAGCDFSYPDHVEGWLNAWAKESNLDLRFESINCGRVALRSMDFEAIVRYELLPVEPDIVLYYEGRNQFWISDLVGYNQTDERNQPLKYRFFANSSWLQLLSKTFNHDLLSSIEKSKPSLAIELHPSVNESDPSPDNPNLPISLPTIVSNLDGIKSELDKINAEFILCSFTMITDDSLFQHGLQYGTIYSYWTHEFGKIRLKEIERLNQLENKVFENYANDRQIPFMDVSSDLKMAPDAFIDGIHLTCEGMRLHGWSVFTQLLPLIKQKLESGELPKPSNQIRAEHPFISKEWYLTKMPNL